jgi:hypothetical protein
MFLVAQQTDRDDRAWHEGPSSSDPRYLAVTERRYCAPALRSTENGVALFPYIQWSLDEVGSDHSDVISVRKEAVRTFREFLNLGPTDTLWTGEPWKLWVTDLPNDAGQTVLTWK